MSTEFFNDQWRIPSNENQNKISNYSMDLNAASGNFIAINNAGDSLLNNANAFTISAWINPTADTGTHQNIFTNWGNTTAKQNVMIRFNTQESLQFYVRTTNGQVILSTVNNLIKFNQWQHIVATYDGVNMRIYYNGASTVSPAAQTGNVNTSTEQDQIGKRWTYGQYFNGQIDQVTIFDYTLSQDQIIQLGAEGYAFNFIPNDYIDLGTTTSYDTGDLSAAIWVKITNTGATQYIFSNSGSPSIKGFDIKVRGSNEIGVQRYNPTNGAESGWFSPGFVYDAWQHLAFTYEESTGTIKTFLNGNLVATNTGTSTATLPSVKLTIGSYKGTQNYANGELSNAAIFSSKLEDSEIATLYNNGKPGNISSLNPTAWYKLDDSEIFNSTSTEWSVDNNALPSTYKSSLDFSGDYVNVSSLTDTTYNNLSFSSWVYWQGTQYSSVFSFAENGGSDTLSGFVVEVRTGGEIRVGCDGVGGSGWGIIVSSAITANTWAHIAVTLSSSGGLILYKNGVSIGTNTTQNLTPVYGLAAIGTRAYSGSIPLAGHAFNGRLSNIALWNTTLTGSQITTLYNNGTPEASISHSPVSWWKLDNTTTGIQDSGSASNNGTNNGATEYAGFVNVLAGDSDGMDASNLVASNINGELVSNPMALSPKPIAYYQLGDQSAYNGANYLVPNNSLSDYVFNFDGTDDYIVLSNTVDLGINSSISVWVNLDTNYTGILLGELTYPNGNYFIQARYNDFFVRIGNIYKTFSLTDNALTAGSWHHLAVTRSGDSISTYVDGTFIETKTGYGTSVTTKFDTIADRQTVSTPLEGKIAQLSAFNTTLSTANIETIYNNGAPGDISSLNPTAWYKLNASEIFNNTSTEWSVDNNAYPSVYNSSLDFDGSDSIDCGNDSSLDITGALSISFWIYGETNLAHKGIVSKCPNSSSIPTVAQYHIQYQTNNTLRFVLRNFDLYTGQETTGTVPTVDLNTWQHITMTWNGTNTMTVYKNGLPVCTKVKAITNVSNTSPVLLGERAINGFFNGKLSNTAIWNTELTSTQIGTLYNNGTPASDISSLSPVSWWKLDNTTTGLIDNGSASNNGTNNGATEYAGFVNALAGESSGMDSSNLVVSDLQQTSGYSPYALDFSGITAHLKTNTIPAAINTVTLSAWVKRTGNAGQYAGVFGVRNSVGTPSFGLCWQISFGNNDNKIRFKTSADSSSGWQEVVQNDVMPDDTWHHVAGVADGTNLKIYINGALQTDTKTQTNGTLQSPTSNIFFGMQSTTSSPFNGQLSNCARWNIGLTQAEVIEIYNQGVPSNLNNFSGTAPIGWWQLGSNSSFEGNDWTCLDEIGTDYADSGITAMANDDIVDGPGYSGSGLGSSSIDIVGDAPYSTANGLSENMDVLDRTLDTPIRNTHSIQLDGIDDYINLSTSPSALIGAMNPYSVSAWVYVAQSDLGNGTNYFIIGAQNGIDRWYFRIKDGYARFAYGTLLDNTTLTPITGDQWNHVVFTYNGVDNFNTYINGVNKSTVTNSAIQGVPSFNAFIGALNAGSGAINQFKGKMDEVSIFSSELSGTQVTSIYNNGVPNNILPLNPALWYRFESLTTNAGVVTTADDSGNGLTGTVENGAVLSTIVP